MNNTNIYRDCVKIVLKLYKSGFFYLVEYIIYCIFVVLKLKQSRTN